MEKGFVNHNKPFCEILIHVKSGSVLSSYQTVASKSDQVIECDVYV